MENIFFECESAFTGSINHINICLESAITNYTDELLTNHYVTEAVGKSLFDRLKEFFAKLILAIKNFTKELQIKIEYAISEKQIKRKLKDLREELRLKKISGEKTIELIDYKNMKKVFDKYYNNLITYAKKFSKVKYTKTWQIEDDLDDFNTLLEKCNEELMEASNKKVTWSIMNALDFVEDELRGKSNIFKALNDSMKDFAEIEQIAEGLKTKMNILGTDVIPRHVGLIQRMVNGISAFVRKWTSKIIVGIVFIFA